MSKAESKIKKSFMQNIPKVGSAYEQIGLNRWRGKVQSYNKSFGIVELTECLDIDNEFSDNGPKIGDRLRFASTHFRTDAFNKKIEHNKIKLDKETTIDFLIYSPVEKKEKLRIQKEKQAAAAAAAAAATEASSFKVSKNGGLHGSKTKPSKEILNEAWDISGKDEALIDIKNHQNQQTSKPDTKKSIVHGAIGANQSAISAEFIKFIIDHRYVCICPQEIMVCAKINASQKAIKQAKNNNNNNKIKALQKAQVGSSQVGTTTLSQTILVDKTATTGSGNSNG